MSDAGDKFLREVKAIIDEASAELSEMSMEELAALGCFKHRDTGETLTADQVRAIWLQEAVDREFLR